MIVWIDGRIEPGTTPVIRADDRGFALGDGLFETIAVEAGRPRHFDRHLARLRDGARLLSFAFPPGDAIERAVEDVMAAAAGDVGVLRITLSRGVSGRGIEIDPAAAPTLVVSASRVQPRPGPPRLGIATTTRRDEGSVLSRVKATHYLPSILARQEVRERAYDEAVLLNTSGRIACASVANLFVLIDGEVRTPPVEEGALAGIARSLILEAGVAREVPISRADLARAEAVLLTNALGLRRAAAIEGLALDPVAGEELIQGFAAILDGVDR